jgi:hypothetical protein
MAPNRRRSRLTQLMLFCENVTPVAQWHDLPAASRAEIVRLLAKILRDSHARVREQRDGGHRDE